LFGSLNSLLVFHEVAKLRSFSKATIPMLEKLYLQVAFLYLKEAKSNPAIKNFINFVQNQGRRLIRSEQ
jgi:DNA-binding transcriptional LysR family regulator